MNKRQRKDDRSFFISNLSPDTFLALYEWLGPIHVMSLVRADPPLRDFFLKRLGKKVYELCVEKIRYYAVECTSTAVVSREQWAHLMSVRNVNDFFMGGGEYLRRALTFDFTHLPMRAEFTGRVSFGAFNVQKSVVFNHNAYIREYATQYCVYKECTPHNMHNKSTLLAEMQIFQIHRNFLSSSALFIAHPVGILHDTSVIDGRYPNFREYYAFIVNYARYHPEHSIVLDDEHVQIRDREWWDDIIRALKNDNRPNIVFK